MISPALVRGADQLRRSLLPSLLEARGGNVAVGVTDADLFEIARAYLARPRDHETAAGPVEEPLLVGLVAGGDFFRGKGLADAILARLGGTTTDDGLTYRRWETDLFEPGRSAEIVRESAGRPPCRVGVVGEVATAVRKRFGLGDAPVAAAELRLDLLLDLVQREHRLVKPPEFPAVERDINVVVNEGVAWGDLEEAIRAAAGGLLEECRVTEIWRDADRLGPDRKSLVVALRLRSPNGTLTGQEAADLVGAIVSECGRRCGATLRS